VIDPFDCVHTYSFNFVAKMLDTTFIGAQGVNIEPSKNVSSRDIRSTV
jgi:hypothetical protein